MLTSWNTWKTTLCYQITSMVSEKPDQLVIFYLMLLQSGPPLLGTLVNLLSLPFEISKAFDRVWHASLLSKLPSFGFPPSICSLLLNYLSGRSLSVMVDGSVSHPQPINSGVPQGCVLSPTLFLIFINDLLNVTHNPIHSYADDSTLQSSTIFL